jgi:predicted metalloendopeptidase
MDNARRDTLGLQRLEAEGITLEADMQRIAAAGGTPADYGRLAGRLQDAVGAVGGSPLIMAGAMPDAKDSSTGVMVLAPGALLLEQDEYAQPEHQKLRNLYHMYIVAMLHGIGEPIEAAKTQATKILTMEAQAAAR